MFRNTVLPILHSNRWLFFKKVELIPIRKSSPKSSQWPFSSISFLNLVLRCRSFQMMVANLFLGVSRSLSLHEYFVHRPQDNLTERVNKKFILLTSGLFYRKWDRHLHTAIPSLLQSTIPRFHGISHWIVPQIKIIYLFTKSDRDAFSIRYFFLICHAFSFLPTS